MSITIETLKESMRRQHPDFDIDIVDETVWRFLENELRQRPHDLDSVLRKVSKAFGNQLSVTLGQIMIEFAYSV